MIVTCQVFPGDPAGIPGEVVLSDVPSLEILQVIRIISGFGVP